MPARILVLKSIKHSWNEFEPKIRARTCVSTQIKLISCERKEIPSLKKQYSFLIGFNACELPLIIKTLYSLKIIANLLTC